MLLQQRSFLPAEDPLARFPCGSPFELLDELGRDLPSLLQSPHCRSYLQSIAIPPPEPQDSVPLSMAELRLYYLRLGFLASAYINQVGQPVATLLPKNIARPLVAICQLLGRPTILSYDGYALFNWKRFDKNQAIALGNIDTLQNFVHLYDEHWFILIHVEIEALAESIFSAIAEIDVALGRADDHRLDEPRLNGALDNITQALERQITVLKRIPEHMDARLYHKTFRPYIRFFENVVFEDVPQHEINFRGETGAQSSIMPLLVSLMKIPHQASPLTDHLVDMRNYMPAEHRQIIDHVDALPNFKTTAGRDAYNGVLDAMARFRETHYDWAQQYINRWVDDPRGTGGTHYQQWLKQLIDETRAAQK